jgi:hypothetical protein
MDRSEVAIGALGTLKGRSAPAGEVSFKPAAETVSPGEAHETPDAAETQPHTGGVEDRFETSTKPLLSRKEIEERNADIAQREKIAESMISRDTGVGAPSDKDDQELKATLSKVDTDILQFNKENGTKFIVVKEGQDILDTGVIRKQDPAAINGQADALGKAGRGAIEPLEAEYGPKIKALEDKISTMPATLPAGMLFGGPVPENQEEAMKLQKELGELKSELAKKAAEGLEKGTDDKVRVFSPLSATGGDAGMGGHMGGMASMMILSQPMSTTDMAMSQGAQTPEEIKLFTDTTEKLNGGRLPKLHAEAIKNYEQTIAAIEDPEQRKQSHQIFEDMKKNPQNIPVDQANNMILVPNTYYYRPVDRPDAAPAVVDLHDMQALTGWNDKSGKINGVGEGAVLGQHFYKNGLNTIVMRDTALADRTPIHELGHATKDLVDKKSPEFGRELDGLSAQAYSQATGPDRNPITPYAGTSASENMTEGFSLFYSDPKLLKMKDPELYDIIQKEADFVKSQR